jgi:hypothetical protein
LDVRKLQGFYECKLKHLGKWELQDLDVTQTLYEWELPDLKVWELPSLFEWVLQDLFEWKLQVLDVWLLQP